MASRVCQLRALPSTRSNMTSSIRLRLCSPSRKMRAWVPSLGRSPGLIRLMSERTRYSQETVLSRGA